VTLKSTSVTYRLILGTSPFLALEYVPMNIGNDGVGIQNAVVDVRNEGVGIDNVVVDTRDEGTSVHNVVMNVRNSHVCIYRKLSLGIRGQL